MMVPRTAVLSTIVEIRIGTSGWHYQHWRGPFYPARCSASEMLEYYSRHFDTVEINNSFYKLPSEDTFDDWREQSPAGFCFAVKASRFITHNKKLGDAENALRNFLPRAGRLREKLGPVLFQLPPRWNINLERLEQFLGVLQSSGNRRKSDNQRRYAFEFRNPTWHTRETCDVLRRHNAAFCLFDLAGFQTPLEITADWTYIRLHGPGDKYQGSYSGSQLRAWARQIRSWRRTLRAVYVYFDNDQAGYAAQNALELKRLLCPGTGREHARGSARHGDSKPSAA